MDIYRGLIATVGGDYPLPDWAVAYMERIESALGEAYTEPAQDVRGYIASVKN